MLYDFLWRLHLMDSTRANYGQLFGATKAGPYRFRVWVRLPQRTDEIEFSILARSPHRHER